MFISINAHTIRKNARHGTNDPPIRITKTKSGKPIYAHAIEVIGDSRLIYSPKKPILKCGARLVLECDEVRVIE